MFSRILLISLIFNILQIGMSQTPFENTYGDLSTDEVGKRVESAADGGAIILGTGPGATSRDRDLYLVKTDASGNQSWAKSIGTNRDDLPAACIVVSDGYILIGTTWEAGNADVLYIKTDLNGNVTKGPLKITSALTDEYAYDAVLLTGGNIAIAGKFFKSDFNGDDIGIWGITQAGVLSWSTSSGNSSIDYGFCIDATPDGGAIVGGLLDNNKSVAIRVSAAGAIGLTYINSDPVLSTTPVYDIKAISNTDYIMSTIGWIARANAGAVAWKTDTKTILGGTDRNSALKFKSGNYYSVVFDAATKNSATIYVFNANGGKQWEAAAGNILASDIAVLASNLVVTGTDALSDEYAGMNVVGYVASNTNGTVVATKTYGSTGNNNNEFGRSVVKGSDGYYLLGTKQSQLKKEELYVVKTDLNGSMQWNKPFGNITKDVPGSILIAQDGGIVFCGSSPGGHYAAKVTTAGAVTWEKTYPYNGTNEISQIIQTSDNGFAFITAHAGPGSTKRGAFLIRIKSDGSELWHKKYFLTDSTDTQGFSVVQAADGGFVIAGTGKNAASESAPILIKTDANGNLVWRKSYQVGSNTRGRFTGISKTSDGGYISSGTIYNSGTKRYSIYILKTDASGTTTWQKELTYPKFDFYNTIQVIQTSDNKYVICGFREATAPNVFSDKEHNGEGILLKMDGLGNLVVPITAYGRTNDASFYTVIPDGTGFTAIGSKRTDGAFQIFLARLLSNLNVGIFEPSIPVEPLSLYPNPVSDHISIQWNSEYTGQVLVRIADMQGREWVRKLELKDQDTFQWSEEVNDIPKGTYILRCDMDKKAAAGIFIKQ